MQDSIRWGSGGRRGMQQHHYQYQDACPLTGTRDKTWVAGFVAGAWRHLQLSRDPIRGRTTISTLFEACHTCVRPSSAPQPPAPIDLHSETPRATAIMRCSRLLRLGARLSSGTSSTGKATASKGRTPWPACRPPPLKLTVQVLRWHFHRPSPLRPPRWQHGPAAPGWCHPLRC